MDLSDGKGRLKVNLTGRIAASLLASLFFLLLGLSPVFPSDLQVHFIDVGQGDSILVIAPNGKKILIDAGIHSGKDDRWNPFNYIRRLKNEGRMENLIIDFAIITHPHDDHYGGFRYLCGEHGERDGFHIGSIFYSVGEPKAYGRFWDCLQSLMVKAQNYGQVWARGPPIEIGEDVEFTVLYPFERVETASRDKNEDSVVARLKYKEVSFLLTGDTTARAERKLLIRDIKSNVLKLGHHGSRTSSDGDFLMKVRPDSGDFHVIISSNYQDDKGKRYGHPDKEVLERVKGLEGRKLYRTDLQGTIVFVTDGKAITVETQNKGIPEGELWNPGLKGN